MSLHKELRRDVSCALGEAQSESCWVEAGIAVEVVRHRLETHFRGFVLQDASGKLVRGDEYVRSLMAAS
jgi:hypothetical protein